MRCRINVDEGADTATYDTLQAPTYKAVWVPAPEGQEEPSRLVFCVFTPLNGHDKGKLLQVPFSRIISVASDE